MAQTWGGKTYNMDWEPIEEGGKVVGPKDWAASNANQQLQPQAAAPPAGSSVAPTPTTPAPTADWQGLSDQTFGTIKRDMALDGTVNQQDPAYQQQVQSNQLQTNLAADRARAAAVQRRAATGTGTSGAVDTDINKVLEQQALQDKTFEGNLLDKFRSQNLQRAAQGLQLGAGMLTAEQERALRGSLTREGYDVQRDLAADDLGFRRDALGQQLALSQADLDQRAMLALLGGG